MKNQQYKVKVYMTDASKIQSSWGSNDEAFLKKCLEKYDGVLTGMNEAFGLEEPLSIQKVFEDFVRGEITCHELSETYGYVYELLVYEFGKIFNFEDDLDGLCLEFLDQIDGEVSAFVEIPLPEGEFPHFLSIANANLSARKEKFLNSLPEDHSEVDKMLLKEQLVFVFDETQKANLDLAFFNY